MYITAGRNVGFPSKFWLLMSELSSNAWMNTTAAAKRIFIAGVNIYSYVPGIKSLAKGSINTNCNLSGTWNT
jgi:hypothetical protein